MKVTLDFDHQQNGDVLKQLFFEGQQQIISNTICFYCIEKSMSKWLYHTQDDYMNWRGVFQELIDNLNTQKISFRLVNCHDIQYFRTAMETFCQDHENVSLEIEDEKPDEIDWNEKLKMLTEKLNASREGKRLLKLTNTCNVYIRYGATALGYEVIPAFYDPTLRIQLFDTVGSLCLILVRSLSEMENVRQLLMEPDERNPYVIFVFNQGEPPEQITEEANTAIYYINSQSDVLRALTHARDHIYCKSLCLRFQDELDH